MTKHAACQIRKPFEECGNRALPCCTSDIVRHRTGPNGTRARLRISSSFGRRLGALPGEGIGCASKAAALTVRMEMLVAPAEPCPRQPDRVDAEWQRREQRSELERGACSREDGSDQRSASWAISARRWKRKIVRTRAGKKDAVARFWRNAPAARPLSLMSCCGKGKCLRGILVKRKKQPSSSPWMGSCRHVCR